ncbi:MAG: penicillin-binding protein activator LpoB [Candidatus Krumholzibacteriota bacterium]|nr:penicillin-binding protein activator LpoB [Candidatus Krumholzibacteriota bacterium]
MKKWFLLLICLFLVAGCGKPATREIDIATDTAEDADFSSADLAKITDAMINSMEANGFYQKYAGQHGGEKPILLLAKSLLNKTDEHIETRLVLEKIRTAMMKDNMAQFVDDQAFDMALDQLNLQATDLYDNSKAARLGRFVGAKFILRGTITNIRKQDGRETINFFNVTLDIFEVETLLIKWTDEVEFKRASTKGKVRR